MAHRGPVTKRGNSAARGPKLEALGKGKSKNELPVKQEPKLPDVAKIYHSSGGKEIKIPLSFEVFLPASFLNVQ